MASASQDVHRRKAEIGRTRHSALHPLDFEGQGRGPPGADQRTRAMSHVRCAGFENAKPEARALVAALQPDHLSGLETQRNTLVIDDLQFVFGVREVNLRRCEFIDDREPPAAQRGDGAITKGRHSASRIAPLVARKGDDAPSGAMDRPFDRPRARAEAAGDRICVGQGRPGGRQLWR